MQSTRNVETLAASEPAILVQYKDSRGHTSPWTPDPCSNPNSAAIGFIASMTNWMCSFNSTPKSEAPRSISSRLTVRANPLDFIFLRTLEAVKSVMPAGLTSAAAVINPECRRRLIEWPAFIWQNNWRQGRKSCLGSKP